MLKYQRWFSKPVPNMLFLAGIIMMVFTVTQIHSQGASGVVQFSSTASLKPNSNIFSLQFLATGGQTFQGSISITYAVPTQDKNPELPSGTDFSSSIGSNAPKIELSPGTPFQPGSWTISNINNVAAYTHSFNIPSSTSSFTVSMKLVFRSLLSIKLNDISNSSGPIYTWSWNYAETGPPLPFSYLFPVLKIINSNNDITLTLNRLPKFTANGRALYLQFLLSGPAFTEVSAAGVDTTWTPGTGDRSHGLLQFAESATILLPIVINIKTTSINARSSMYVMDINPPSFSTSTTDSEMDISFAELVSATSIYTSLSPLGNYLQNYPRIKINAVVHDNPSIGLLGSDGFWYKSTISIMPIAVDETIYFIPQLDFSRESHLHFCIVSQDPNSYVESIDHDLIHEFQITLKVTTDALAFGRLDGPIVLNCYGTVSPFARLRANNNIWPSPDVAPFITNLRIGIDAVSGANLDPTGLPTIEYLPENLPNSVHSQEESRFIFHESGNRYQTKITLTLQGYSYAVGVKLQIPKECNLVSSNHSLDDITLPVPDNSPQHLSYSNVNNSLESLTTTWECTFLDTELDYNSYTCYFPPKDMINLSVDFFISTSIDFPLPNSLIGPMYKYQFFKIHHLSHLYPQMTPLVVATLTSVLPTISDPPTPVVLGTPLAASPGVSISLYQQATSALPTAPETPILNVGSGTVSVQFNPLNLELRDAIQISFYYFPSETPSTPTLLHSVNAQTVPTTPIITTFPTAGLPSSSVVFAMIHFIGKPDLAQNNDPNEFLHSYFLTSFFKVTPTCNFLPASEFNYVNDDIHWQTKCWNYGKCRSTDGITYGCVCKNGFSGPLCENTSCFGCLHRDSCNTSNVFDDETGALPGGQCVCKTGWTGSKCNQATQPDIFGFPRSVQSTTGYCGVSIYVSSLTSLMELPTTPPASASVTLTLPILSFNIVIPQAIASLPRDTILVQYYYFPSLSAGTLPKAIDSLDPILINFSTIFSSLSSPPPDLTKDSAVFATIRYTSKPVSDDASIGTTDQLQWVDTFFVTQYFKLDTTTCNVLPTSASESFVDLNDASKWSTSCLNGGNCQENSHNFKCACQDDSTGGPICDQVIKDVSLAQNTVSFSLNLDTPALTQLSPANTVYFRIGLIGAPEGNKLPLEFDVDRDILTWLTASFLITSSQADLQSSLLSKEMLSQIIPAFVPTLTVEIPSVFGQFMDNLAIFIEPINIDSTHIPVYRYLLPIPALQHSCSATANDKCISCDDPTQNTNWFSTSGCDDFFHNAVYARSSHCSGLKCPIYMNKDYNSCVCICTSQICKDRTRSTMLYTSPFAYKSKYGKSLYYHQITNELTAILGLNTLPLPSTSTLLHGGFLDQNVSISPALQLNTVDYVKPIGYEELLVTPMTYTTMDTQSMMITITMTPFDDTTLPTTSQINARYAYFTLKLKTLFSSENLSHFKFFTKNASSRLDITLALPQPVTLNTFEWKKYSSSSSPSQLSTSCKLPTADGDTSALQKCPTAAQLKTSPYWSKCASTTDVQHIFPVCIDLFGLPTLYDSSSSSWCGTSSILYPNFPPTIELPGTCTSEQSFDPPAVLSLTLSSSSNLIMSGDAVVASWSSIENLNPAHTVSFYLRLGSPPAVDGFSIFDSLEDEYDDSNFISNLNYDVDSFKMVDVQQTALEKGYSVLLGTFPIASKTAFLTMPVTKTDTLTSVYIFALLNQRKTNQIIPTPSSFSLMDRNMCEVSTCAQNAHQVCQRTTGACICAPLFRSVMDDSTNTMTCVSICDNQCGQDGQGGTCQEDTGTCKCSADFTGSRCEIALNCNTQNKDLCSDNGSVSFIAQQCGSECTCFGSWGPNGTKPCSQCEYTTFTAAMPLCDKLGTDVVRTEKEKCSQCFCKKGYEGPRCATRSMYGTVTFTAPYTNAVDYNKTPLALSAEAMEALVRDLALSMGVSEDVITISQIRTTTIAPTPSPAASIVNAITASLVFSSQQDKTNSHAVTFAVSTAADDNAMSSLYDSWNNLKTNFDQVPISQTEAQQEVGTPSGVQEAYDPVCVSSTEVTCPTGFDPFVTDDENPSESSTGDKATSAAIVIIIVVVVAVVVLVGISLLLFCAKKHKKLCFNQANKRDNNNDHLELTTHSETSTARNNSKTQVKSTTTTKTAYSSGTSESIDLVECNDNDGTQVEKLPPGWKKMRHTGTGDVLYVNNKLMVSQRHSPLDTATDASSWA